MQQHRQASRTRLRGLTLLELVIILLVAGVIVLIALPTLQPSSNEADTEFAKTSLRYLWNQQNAYFNRHGKYVPFLEIATDAELGQMFDQRYAAEAPVVNGVKFEFPNPGGGLLELTATLQDGTAYIINQQGEVKQFQVYSEGVVQTDSGV